jgi:hypothetical protein
MTDTKQSAFVMTVNSSHEIVQTRLLIQSLRAYGGVMCNNPVMIFVPDERSISSDVFDDLEVEIYPLVIPDVVENYWFARKVCTCAHAENSASPDIESLIWFSYDCFIIQPPVLLKLDAEIDAAFRPVHGTNIGLPVDKPLNDFWQTIYDRVNLPRSQFSVESYVDKQHIRAYFNSHCFSWNPATGLAQRWYAIFKDLVSDRSYQLQACYDIQHQVFLHQAVLSALVEKMISPERLRILPPVYSYPYNMHSSIPAERRIHALNDLVCIAYEDRSLHPSAVQDIEIREPLKGWLAEHIN